MRRENNQYGLGTIPRIGLHLQSQGKTTKDSYGQVLTIKRGGQEYGFIECGTKGA